MYLLIDSWNRCYSSLPPIQRSESSYHLSLSSIQRTKPQQCYLSCSSGYVHWHILSDRVKYNTNKKNTRWQVQPFVAQRAGRNGCHGHKRWAYGNVAWQQVWSPLSRAQVNSSAQSVQLLLSRLFGTTTRGFVLPLPRKSSISSDFTGFQMLPHLINTTTLFYLLLSLYVTPCKSSPRCAKYHSKKWYGFKISWDWLT